MPKFDLGSTSRSTLTLLALLAAAVVPEFASAVDLDSTAAIVIGGSVDEAGNSAVASVEIFGCPGAEEGVYPLEGYPVAVYGASGMFIHDGANGDRALVCGGWMEDGGEAGSQCYSWKPETPGQWEAEGSLENAT